MNPSKTAVPHSAVTMGRNKTWYCSVCNHEMRNDNKIRHLNSKKHQLKTEPNKTWRCILDKNNPLKMKIVRIDVPQKASVDEKPKKTKSKQNEVEQCTVNTDFLLETQPTET